MPLPQGHPASNLVNQEAYPASRPRHPEKDLEATLREAERKGWKVTKGKKYYRMRCACGIHQRTVHVSPSDPNYRRSLVGWLNRTGCW